jgi:hypothetical protein
MLSATYFTIPADFSVAEVGGCQCKTLININYIFFSQDNSKRKTCSKFITSLNGGFLHQPFAANGASTIFELWSYSDLQKNQ